MSIKKTKKSKHIKSKHTQKPKHTKKPKLRRRKTKRNQRRQYKAGAPIDQGGVGCIFKPLLPYDPETVEILDDAVVDKMTFLQSINPNNYISKLMRRDQAAIEINIYKNVYQLIKDYHDSSTLKSYFLIEGVFFSKLDPTFFTNDPNSIIREFYGFKTKCSNLVNKLRNSLFEPYKAHNTNYSQIPSLDYIQTILAKFTTIINMPDSGTDLETFFHRFTPNETNLNTLITILQNVKSFLNDALLPINQLGFYHADLKDSNVLVDLTKNYKLKCIDYGYSFIYKPITQIQTQLSSSSSTSSQIQIPKINGVINYNTPFSSMLFSTEFKYDLNAIITIIKSPIENAALERIFFTLCYHYLYKIYTVEKNNILSYNVAHMTSMNRMWSILDDRDNPTKINDMNMEGREKYNISSQTKPPVSLFNSENMVWYYIIRYNVAILMKYTTYHEDKGFYFFDMQGYFENVFIHSVDIWGFIMILKPFFEINVTQMRDNYQACLQLLVNQPIEPLNTDVLLAEINRLLDSLLDSIKLLIIKDREETDDATRTMKKRRIYT
jgi:hypothetical protein